jgi:hypothetical protein
VEKRFQFDYRGTEAALSRRILNRALYGGQKWGAAWPVVVPVLIYLGFAGHAYFTLWLGDMTAPVIVASGMVMLAYIRLAAPWFNRRRLARLSGAASIEGRQVAYEFEDEGFRIRTEHFEAFQKWAGVDRIIGRGGMVLIMLGPNAHFLPRRLFESEEEQREFLAWALQKLTPEAQARSKIGKT